MIDKLNDLIERRFNDRPAATDNGKAENCALPQILIASFGHGDIETLRDPRLNSLDDAPFYL